MVNKDAETSVTGDVTKTLETLKSVKLRAIAFLILGAKYFGW